jgi:hypothetical protein
MTTININDRPNRFVPIMSGIYKFNSVPVTMKSIDFQNELVHATIPVEQNGKNGIRVVNKKVMIPWYMLVQA